jgi:hypothetical protein
MTRTHANHESPSSKKQQKAALICLRRVRPIDFQCVITACSADPPDSPVGLASSISSMMPKGAMPA